MDLAGWRRCLRNDGVEPEGSLGILPFTKIASHRRIIAKTLRLLAKTNRSLGLHEEGTQQLKEAPAMDERPSDTVRQAQSLCRLAELLYDGRRPEEAEEAASRTIELLFNTDSQFLVCQCLRVLGPIYRSKGETEKAIDKSDVALRIGSPFNWHDYLSWAHNALAGLLCLH